MSEGQIIEMNWLYFIVMAYIILSALRGFHKGFLKVVYSMVGIVVAIVFVSLVTPYISHMIQRSSVSEQIESGCEDYIREQVSQKLNEDNLAQILVLPWFTLPKKLQKELKKGSPMVIADILENHGVYKKAAKVMAGYCMNVIAFFAALLVILLILFVIGRKLDMFSKTPGIHIANMIMGFVAGIAKAFLGIWTAFLLIKITSALPFSAALIALIEENAVLKNLYDQNRILELLQHFMNIK